MDKVNKGFSFTIHIDTSLIDKQKIKNFLKFNKKDFFWFFLDVAIFLIMIFIIHKDLKKLSHRMVAQNFRNRNYDLYDLRNFKRERSYHFIINPPKYITGDSFFSNDYYSQIFENLSYHYCYTDLIKQGDESPALSDVRVKFIDLKPIIENKSFYSVFNLLVYLNSISKSDVEQKILRYLLKDSPYFDFDTENIYFTNYILNYYINPTFIFIRNKQYYKAKWMIQEAVNRLFIVDTDPLNKPPAKYIDFLNKVLLMRTILDDPSEIMLDVKNFELIYAIINESNYDIFYDTKSPTLYNDEFTELKIDKASKFYPIYLYMNGLQMIKKRDYQQAFSLFKEVYNSNSGNAFLNQLDLNLLARCLFWNSNKSQFKNKKLIIIQLKKIKDKLTIPNFITDIDFYINYIISPTPPKKTVIELNLDEFLI
jgi:hypothetical protein